MNFEDYSSLSDYAKKIGVVAGNLKNWVEKADVKPAGKFGNTNVYLVADLVKAVGENSSSANALRAVGYVHPDKYQEVVERAQRLAVANAEQLEYLGKAQDKADEDQAAINGYSDLLDRATEKYNELLANFNGLQAEYSLLSQKIEDQMILDTDSD